MAVTLKSDDQNLDFEALSHEFGSTTHLVEIDPRILEPYGSAPLFINGDFDFTNLILNNDHFSFTSTDGEYYSSPDNPNYSGMVYYGRQGDVDGDGANELVISGWGPDGKNTSGRIYVLNLEKSGELIDYAWEDIPGTTAPWVYDFDSDGERRRCAPVIRAFRGDNNRAEALKGLTRATTPGQCFARV